MELVSNIVLTGGSEGLGLALARVLARQGHLLTIDARRADLLESARHVLAEHTTVSAVRGDVADPRHRAELVATAAAHGPIDVVINNASELGGSPQPRLRDLTSQAFRRIWEVNVAAPLELVRLAWPHLAASAVIVSISSDAGVEHYPGWGGYGASKAALDHLMLTWAAEEPSRTWYAVDPGDLRTAMHQAAFPGEDISDRTEPGAVAPVLAALLESQLPSGRYRCADLAGRPEIAGAASGVAR